MKPTEDILCADGGQLARSQAQLIVEATLDDVLATMRKATLESVQEHFNEAWETIQQPPEGQRPLNVEHAESLIRQAMTIASFTGIGAACVQAIAGLKGV